MWHRWLSDSLKNRIKGWRESYWQKRFALVINTYHIQGADSAVSAVREVFDKQTHRENALITLSRHAMKTDVNDAFLFVRALAADCERIDRLKWVAIAAWDSGSIQFANEILSIPGVMELANADPLVTEKTFQIQGAYNLLNKLPDIPTHSKVDNYEPDQRKILYVASSSRPYHMTGYTARTHHLLESLCTEGWDVHCVTRPGYPYDRPDTVNLTDKFLHIIDGVIYERLDGLHRREIAYDEYLEKSVEALIQAAQRVRPIVIHAASNYEAALPALIAARRLGISFCYEVRGLWEYTAASKKNGWENTERFLLDRMLETHTASNADAVFTLTKALATELSNRGVPLERIRLMPNAVNLAFFKHAVRDEELAHTLELEDETFVCGYVGSVVKYEGLDDLVLAWRAVVNIHPNSRLLIVGSGDELENLVLLAKRLNIDKYITFTGRVTHDNVIRYFSLLNAISLPRKPFNVCKLVSPLKPFEAMAMKVPLVVSDVEALAEIFVDGETALIHKAGDSDSLAEALLSLAQNRSLQKKLSANAFNQVCLESQWFQVIKPLCEFYRNHQAKQKNKLRPRLRVLTVGSLPPEWGGASRGGVASIHRTILEQWLRYSDAYNIDVVGSLINNWGGESYSEKPENLNIFVPPSDKQAERDWYQNLLHQEKVDVVLFFHIANRWGYWHAQMQPLVPAVASIHSWSAITVVAADKATLTMNKLQKAMPSFKQLLFPSAHCLNEGRDLGFEYIAPVAVVPNAVGTTFINIDFAQNPKARIVFVGSLIPVKRADLVIRAAAHLGIDLVLIGDGEELQSLQELANLLAGSSSIEFKGQLPPELIARILVDSSLLCVPSESESFGIVYLEALACGIPVVGFAPSITEIEATLGMQVGVGVTASENLHSVINAIQQALSLKIDSKVMRDVVAKNYSPSAVSEGYLRVIQQATISPA